MRLLICEIQWRVEFGYVACNILFELSFNFRLLLKIYININHLTKPTLQKEITMNYSINKVTIMSQKLSYVFVMVHSLRYS